MSSPPITIGELIDVPAPDSPIASAWAQEVSHRVVHRFATVAERDTKYAAASAGYGSICSVGANALYMSDGIGWLVLVEPPRTYSGLWSGFWAGDTALPQIWGGAQATSATTTAWFVRRGWSVQFAITLSSGAAGAISNVAGFNLPYNGNVLSSGAFVGSWTSNVGVIAPCLFYPGANGWTAGFYGGAAAGAASTMILPGGSVPFAGTPNQSMAVGGTYFAAVPPYG